MEQFWTVPLALGFRRADGGIAVEDDAVSEGEVGIERSFHGGHVVRKVLEVVNEESVQDHVRRRGYDDGGHVGASVPGELETA